MVAPDVVESRIRDGIEGVSYLVVKDLTGTQDHYEATVVSKAFVGKSRVQQHQMVYRALGELMAGAVHALALNTFTPDTWAETQG